MSKIAGQQFNPSQGTPSPTPPDNPFDGQLWYNPSDNILRLFDSSANVFKDISGPSDDDFFLNDGLVAHYKMDEGVQNFMTDELATHDLNRFGAIDAASTTGVLNLARQFVGSSSQFYANSTDIDAPGRYTVAAHIRFDGVGAGPLFMAGYTAGGTLKAWELRNDSIEFFNSGGSSIVSQSFSTDLLDTAGNFNTIVFSVDYDDRWRVLKDGALFDSGVAPTSAQGLAFGQIRIGAGLAFTIDSMSIYNERDLTEAFAVTYHNSGNGIPFDDYPITNIRRVPLGILASGINQNTSDIATLNSTALFETGGLQDALDNADSPSAGNPFLTESALDDIPNVSAAISLSGSRANNANGIQTFNHNLGVVPSLFQSFSAVVGTSSVFWATGGAWYDGTVIAEGSSCKDTNTFSGGNLVSESLICYQSGSGSHQFIGNIQNITTTQFDILWTSVGSPGTTETISFRIIVGG